MIFLEKSRERIERSFEELCGQLPGVMGAIREKIRELEVSEKRTALALKYLYGTMPYSDIGNYEFSVFFEYARHGGMLWEQYGRVRRLPEDMYLQYVLYHRVNEEEIDTCRGEFYDSIRRYLEEEGEALPDNPELAFGEGAEALWVEAASTGQKETLGADTAALRRLALLVNLWCAAQASYRSSDERTASAKTVYRCGYGRCGEESAFAVNALRSVGVPARQVYAPRWAHCDDNHAWVEVWTGDGWHFLGACEPAPALDEGWFIGAASRAMLVHARSFDPLGTGSMSPGCTTEGMRAVDAEIPIGMEGMVRLLNETGRYAKTRTVTVRVQTPQGEPVSGAVVHFQILNYAELVTIAQVTADEVGRASLLTGCGSIWAEVQGKGEAQGALMIEPGDGDACRVLTLGCPKNVSEEWTDFEMYAPPGRAAAPESASIRESKSEPSAAQNEFAVAQGELSAAQNEPTAQYELENFPSRAEQASSCHQEKVKKWRNPEIDAFLARGETEPHSLPLRRKMLGLLSQKDLADGKASVLEAHLRDFLHYGCKEEPALSYVLNPRIQNEVLTPWRGFLRSCFSQEQQESFRENPPAIWQEIRSRIREESAHERMSLLTTPAAAWRLGVAGEDSQKLLFVAVARTFGIPARLDPKDESMEYWRDGAFWKVLPEEEEDAVLELSAGDSGTSWVYHQNWTLALFKKGSWKTLELGDPDWLPEREGQNAAGKGGAAAGAGVRLSLPNGRYRLLTTNRLPNGNQFASFCEFLLKPGEKKRLTLRQRKAGVSDLLSHIPVSDFELREYRTDRKICASGLARDKKMLFIWLKEGQEPTEHILNELRELRRELGEYQDRVVLIFQSGAALQNPTVMKCREALPDMKVCFHTFGKTEEKLARSVYTEPERWPLMLVTYCEGAELIACYGNSGYNVGSGAMSLRILMA